MNKPQISEAVKEKYRMKPAFSAGKYHFRGSEIDTTTVSLETLEEAVANGFDVVEPTNKKNEPKK